MNKAALKRKKKLASRGGSAGAASDSPAAWMRNLLLGVGSTVAIGLTLLLIGSLGAYFCPEPSAVIVPFGIAASLCTSLLGGMLSAHLLKQHAPLCGLFNGCAVLALMLPLSLCFAKYSSHHSAPMALLLHLAFLLCSVLGAQLGSLHEKRRRQKKHPHKRRK